MHSKILKLIFVLTSVFVLQSCLTNKKITQLIERKVGSEVRVQKTVNTNALLLNTDSLPKMDAVAVVKKGKSFVIPAIFFLDVE